MAYNPSRKSGTVAAYELGVRFAKYLNANAWGDPWPKFTDKMNIPQADQAILYKAFKIVSSEMQQAYREGFNATLQT